MSRIILDGMFAICDHECMSINPAFSDPEDPHVAAAIARAERRLAMLERLSEIGMNLVEQIGAHAAAAMAAANEDRGGDPGRAYAVVSRAVRMTLALEARFESQILAMRRGELPAMRGVRAPTAELEAAISVAKTPDSRRDRAGDAVREAIHIEVETITDARERLDALNERLFDREAYDVLLNLPLRDAVAAICADLGLEPDWSLWTDDAGFVAPAGRRRVDWTKLCAESPPTEGARAKKPTLHRRQ
jgi:hypothetical protein